MYSHNYTKLLLIALLLAIAAIVSPLLPARRAQAQQDPFLNKPYYGTKTITSQFDHEYPTYTAPPDDNNNIFTRHDGERWEPPTPVEVGNCTAGVNCYDGHNGYDFPMSYERVLAAAVGTVTFVGWYNLDNRNSGYGLFIEITHSEGYVTRYGHLSAAGVEEGQTVLAGQIIGTSGNTGSSTGPHLHFDVRESDTDLAVDPRGWTGDGNDPWAIHPDGAISWFMWIGGEWPGDPVVDPTPSGSPEVIVDDQDDEFSKGCAEGSCDFWYEATAGWPYDSPHMWWTYDNNFEQDYWARWQPTLPQPGIYEVWVHIPLSTHANSYQAPYTVHNVTSSPITALVDQYGLANQWVCIGEYHFLAGSSGYVRVTDATGETGAVRPMGVDAVKFVQRPTYPVYAPDLKRTSGWVSYVVIRNNGINPTRVNISYLDSSGSYIGSASSTIPGNGTATFYATGGDTLASAVVDASEDVSVVVENKRGDEITIYNGILASGGSPGWERVGATLYAPIIKNNWHGRYSILRVLNTGPSDTTVSVTYYQLGGTPVNGGTLNLAPNDRGTFTPSQCTSGRCSAVISSDGQPLAAVVFENRSDQSQPSTHNVFSTGNVTTYAPLVKKRFGGSKQTTGLAVQNLGNSDASVTVTYYGRDGGTYPGLTLSVPPGASHVAYAGNEPNLPSGFIGSAALGADQPIALLVYEAGGEKKKCSSGFLGGSATAILPDVYGEQGGRKTGITVQNVGGSGATVTIEYYYTTGDYHSSTSHWVEANRQWTFSIYNGGVPHPGFQGSAVATAGQPIVVIANTAGSGSGDTHASFNGANR